MTKRFALLLTVASFLLASTLNGYAQERQKTGSTANDARPVQKAADQAKPADAEPAADASLDRAILTLSQQITALTKEVKKMREDAERNSTMLELLLCEERLLRLEERIEQAINNKAQLDARAQDLLHRQRNISQELILRGGNVLRRDEAEAAIRQELQRALDDTRAQQTATQAKIGEMQAQADRLRYRIEALRQKAARLEGKLEEK